MTETLLSLSSVTLTINGKDLLQDISLELKRSEQWALIGASGAGKTLLGLTISGKYFHKGIISAGFGNPEDFHQEIAMVEQQSRFKDLNNRSQFYYQQRYNASDAGSTITVADSVEPFRQIGSVQPGEFEISWLLEQLHLTHALEEPLIQLSSGEHKRLQILKALLRPHVLLILDQPMTGLDKMGRQIAMGLFEELCKDGTNFLLICSPDEIPDWITHIALLDKGKLIKAGTKSQMKEYLVSESISPVAERPPFLDSTPPNPERGSTELIRMVDVQVSYGGKKVLSHIDWEMRSGEKWAISGPNGAGKSTLLSLITADHPQAYANEIYLFGRRRGSGESIWDIKQKIGFLSAELHSYFDMSMTCFQAMASGFFDTIGLFRQISKEQSETVQEWFRLFSISGCEHRFLSEMPLGKQRLVLLARALIKNPPLLILDEPCHGLDASQAKEIRILIDQYAQLPDTSLIYVTHYPQEIPEAVNRFLQLDHGRIV
ncbi:MAG: ATP-binding cassette domain-containing protein [Chitinophagales bacterium]